MDPTSTEESTPWDPITGRLRPHTSFRRHSTPTPTATGPGLASTCCRSPDGTARLASYVRRPSSLAGSANKAARALTHRKAAQAVAVLESNRAPEPTSTESSVAFDIINDSSGHNVDADAQTMMGIEIKERFNDMQTAFLSMDLNFDGKISKEELLKACRKWNIPLSEAERVMNCADADKNGYIEFDEFAKRFDPSITVTPDDGEILRLYQQGVMADELPFKQAGAYHGTSTAEPLVDEAANLRADNTDLRGRLARCMGKVEDLGGALDEAYAQNAMLEKAFQDSQCQVTDLTRTLAGLKDDLHRTEESERSLMRKVARLQEDLRRTEESEHLALKRAAEADSELRVCKGFDADLGTRNLAKLEKRNLEKDLEYERSQREQDRIRQEIELERFGQQRNLATFEKSRSPRRSNHDDSKTVLVYGRDGCDKTQAIYSALKKAKVPCEGRDFDEDKSFMKILTNSGYGQGPVCAPVVCLGDKAWWYNPSETHGVPWPQEVACELRHELHLSNVTAPVRVDADIDTEIYERFLSMQDAFLKLDADKDGLITKDELRDRCLQWNIPISEADRIIAEVGSDRGRTLDFDQFAKRFGGHRKWGASRGVLRSQAPAPHRDSKRGRTR